VRLLLDTHVLIWWLLNDARLTRRARELLASPQSEVFVSSASALEISTKHRLGKLPGVTVLVEEFTTILDREQMIGLPITIEHALMAGTMRDAHSDPFDRILAAQSRIDQLSLVTGDQALKHLVPATIW
jgi:PIN domain nuclease of toxin-antitoxin system